MPTDHDATHPPKNRYANAPMRADWTIDQDWSSYSAAEHDRWKRLSARQLALLPGRACDDYLAALEKLQLSQSGVPDFAELSARLAPLTGWSVVAVAGLVPDDVFFDHLAERRFPAGAFIRPEAELDYLEEPDVFHDVFGHVPLLADPIYARFLQAYGEGGRRALARGQLAELARLYWYTVEFGLVSTPAGLRIFGAGILSSPAESVFALEDTSPNRIRFDLERVMRTRYIIDDFQQSYFVVDSFQSLLDACYQDFGPIYDRLTAQSTLEPHEIAPGDRIVARGDFHYFRAKANAA
ncbi:MULTISPECIES: phenylalanine 4-monooxygenase [Methylosinus]|uniref:Phenylalanine-4-hydroxylase n=1 Tax=Methylosinus trichosporium (strain ATCC 35070 / NCIMB 11131 / UNIQEM 75 / OB3b) TaxID=595536 RepID=A0A2D2CZH2_METT3|nr:MULTISPECIES: phenylalanine 4-monooxygenase [Methylosinus]ATQ68039.1 phenylalanine 4-monooxygenase [Methylosinus trichosporium OB3b]OBS53688.1 phenylalanine-4-hydroxylase [Methylosinus sp. 3S-1]